MLRNVLIPMHKGEIKHTRVEGECIESKLWVMWNFGSFLFKTKLVATDLWVPYLYQRPTIDLTMVPCHHSLLEPPGLQVKAVLMEAEVEGATDSSRIRDSRVVVASVMTETDVVTGNREDKQQSTNKQQSNNMQWWGGATTMRTNMTNHHQ